MQTKDLQSELRLAEERVSLVRGDMVTAQQRFQREEELLKLRVEAAEGKVCQELRGREMRFPQNEKREREGKELQVLILECVSVQSAELTQELKERDDTIRELKASVEELQPLVCVHCSVVGLCPRACIARCLTPCV